MLSHDGAHGRDSLLRDDAGVPVTRAEPDFLHLNTMVARRGDLPRQERNQKQTPQRAQLEVDRPRVARQVQQPPGSGLNLITRQADPATQRCHQRIQTHEPMLVAPLTTLEARNGAA